MCACHDAGGAGGPTTVDARCGRRFSEFAQFHEMLEKIVLPDIKLPQLPAKSWRRHFTDAFRRRRAEKLQRYLDILLSSAWVNGCASCLCGVPVLTHTLAVCTCSGLAAWCRGQVRRHGLSGGV